MKMGRAAEVTGNEKTLLFYLRRKNKSEERGERIFREVPENSVRRVTRYLHIPRRFADHSLLASRSSPLPVSLGRRGDRGIQN